MSELWTFLFSLQFKCNYILIFSTLKSLGIVNFFQAKKITVPQDWMSPYAYDFYTSTYHSNWMQRVDYCKEEYIACFRTCSTAVPI